MRKGKYNRPKIAPEVLAFTQYYEKRQVLQLRNRRWNTCLFAIIRRLASTLVKYIPLGMDFSKDRVVWKNLRSQVKECGALQSIE